MPAAIDWLCRCFGFKRQMVVADEDGRTVHHAQLLTQSGGMVMADNAASEYGRIRHPDEAGGFETQSPYLIVSGATDVYRKVKARGGTIVGSGASEPTIPGRKGVRA